MLKSVAVVLLFVGGLGGAAVVICRTPPGSAWVLAAFTGIVAVVTALGIAGRIVDSERPARDPNEIPIWRCIAEPLAIWAGIFAVLYVVGTLVHLAVR